MPWCWGVASIEGLRGLRHGWRSVGAASRPSLQPQNSALHACWSMGPRVVDIPWRGGRWGMEVEGAGPCAPAPGLLPELPDDPPAPAVGCDDEAADGAPAALPFAPGRGGRDGPLLALGAPGDAALVMPAPVLVLLLPACDAAAVSCAAPLPLAALLLVLVAAAWLAPRGGSFGMAPAGLLPGLLLLAAGCWEVAGAVAAPSPSAPGPTMGPGSSDCPALV